MCAQINQKLYHQISTNKAVPLYEYVSSRGHFLLSIFFLIFFLVFLIFLIFFLVFLVLVLIVPLPFVDLEQLPRFADQAHLVVAILGEAAGRGNLK